VWCRAFFMFFRRNTMTIPTNLKYDVTDEWVRVEGNIAVIGVSDYAQDSLSDIVFFEAVVSVGDEISAKDQIATLESVKAAADINAPVSGKVVAINEDLGGAPETVNSDPYGKGWMVKIEMSNSADLNHLMDSATYEKYLSERSH
jgi:glycine cleavage system H protein